MIKQNIKYIISRFAPNFVLKFIKSYHYYYSLKTFQEDREPDLAILRRIIKKDSLAIDIGANYGLYTKYLAEFVGPSGLVISFEPIPFTYSFLKDNIRRLHLDNAIAECIALTNHEGSATMLIPKFEEGNTNYYQASLTNHRNSNNTESIEVKTQTLDNYLEALNAKNTLSLIKIDAEGSEYEVLKGAEKSLLAIKPILLIEVAGTEGEMSIEARKLFSFLELLGYTAFYGNHGLLHRWTDKDKILNFFFLTESHVQELKICE